MKVTKNIFGGADEQATIDEFYDLHGRNTAENLDRIYHNHKYSKDWTEFALNEGYKQEVIDDFLILASL